MSEDKIEKLKKKISYLEEELVRKEDVIIGLKKDNELLFKTAMKKSEDKLNS